MFGKKKNNNDKLTTKQKFGIGLIESIANSLHDIANEAIEDPDSYYAAEVKRVVIKLFNESVGACNILDIVNDVQMEEVVPDGE